MIPGELPLLNLFNRLRDHGFLLGMEEYMVVLRALRAGFGVSNRQALKQLCCVVWVKSGEEERLFNRLFEQMLAAPIIHPAEPVEPEPSQPSPRVSPDALSESTDREFPQPSPQQPGPKETSFRPGVDEPVQVVQAIRRTTHDDFELRRSRYSLLTEYFPVTRRQMKQLWRHLRRPVRQGLPEELDVEATVEKVAQEGVFLKPVLVPRRSNRAELVLLIDQDGSMVPFHSLSRQLVETARRGGRLGQAGVYYFHDYPDRYLYGDPARQEAQSISEVLVAVSEWAVVLIVSDAGAARGYYDPERVERTWAFVQQLNQFVRRFAWLNPMPNDRWAGTSAGKIARFVPMFEMSRHGLDTSIRALQGRYVYWEKMHPWIV